MAQIRYLVGVDFSPGSRRALLEARALAQKTGAALTVAHVRPFNDVRAAVAEERGDLVRTGGRVLVRELAAHYARRLGILTRGAEGEELLVLRGAPDVALTRESRKGYAMLILGRTGRNGVSGLFVGSTADRVVVRATIPVLVVPARRG